MCIYIYNMYCDVLCTYLLYILTSVSMCIYIHNHTLWTPMIDPLRSLYRWIPSWFPTKTPWGCGDPSQPIGSGPKGSNPKKIEKLKNLEILQENIIYTYLYDIPSWKPFLNLFKGLVYLTSDTGYLNMAPWKKDEQNLGKWGESTLLVGSSASTLW